MNANWEEIEFELERRSALICELQSQLAALQWRPITEQDLPKLGDEVGKHHNGLFLISRITQGWKIEWQIQDGDWTHFRPLNAPPADKASA